MAEDYVESRRDGVGRESRTRLAEASRKLEEARGLIDVNPGKMPGWSKADAEAGKRNRGGQQTLVRGEPFRGRFRDSYSAPKPFKPGEVTGNMQGKAAEAENIHRQVVEYRTRTSGLDHSETIKSVNFLCESLIKQRKLDEAVAQYRSVIDIYTDLDEKARQEALLTMNSLAETLVQQGHLDQAEAVCRRLVLESERLLGADDCNTLIGVHTLADTLSKQERYGEALQLYERAYIGTEKRCGADHPDTKEFLEDFNRAKRTMLV